MPYPPADRSKVDQYTTTLLNRIVDFYLHSHEFNGIRADVIIGDSGPEARDTLKELVRRGFADVYSSEYDNPHLKRLPPAAIAEQLRFLDSAGGSEHVCLYPSLKTMRRRLTGNKYRQRPFTRFLALGHSQLEPIFFQLSVLGRYQADPRYSFRFDGLDGHISVKTAHYYGRAMSKADKVGLQTFGLGTTSKGHRVIVTFPRYLSFMSARHQQYWETYRVREKAKMERNYALRGLYGQWTDGVSVYDALRAEIFHINKMCAQIGLPNLFRREYSRDSQGEEPKGFGLLMVPTKKHFFEFAQILDKFVSENLNKQFFVQQGVDPEDRIKKKNGEIVVTQKGTLRLLEEWLKRRVRIRTKNGVAIVVGPLKEVRRLRQSPAHDFVDDEFSIKYQTKKEELITEVYRSISNIRMFFQTHPKARNYPFPENLKPENLVIF